MYNICCMIMCLCINIDIVGPSYLGIQMDLGSPGRFVHHRRFPTLSRATRNFSASQLRLLRIGGSLFTAETVGNSWDKMGHLLTLICCIESHLGGLCVWSFFCCEMFRGQTPFDAKFKDFAASHGQRLEVLERLGVEAASIQPSRPFPTLEEGIQELL